jgi:hypothetical protein
MKASTYNMLDKSDVDQHAIIDMSRRQGSLSSLIKLSIHKHLSALDADVCNCLTYMYTSGRNIVLCNVFVCCLVLCYKYCVY